MWNNEYVRKFFFAAGDDDTNSDALFLQRYCSKRTRDHINLHSIKPADLRKILFRLAPLAPDFDHSTPGWNFKGANRLLVCIGRARLQWRNQRHVPVINQPRFGLCAFEGNIHFWTDAQLRCEEDLDKTYVGFQSKHWVFWEHSKNKCYFKDPLVGPGVREKALDLLDDNQPLWNLIQEILENVDGKVKPSSFILSGVSESLQNQLGIPEEITVIYPRQIDDGIAAISLQPEVAPDKRPHRQGATNKRITPQEETPTREPHQTARVQLSEEVEAQFQGLQLPAQEDALLTDAPNIAGRYYVYVLKDPKEDRPFYVGKGAYDRALQHFRAIGSCENVIAPQEEEGHNDLKLGISPNDILKEEESQIECNEKVQNIRDLINSGVLPDDIPRVVARGLSEQAAFTLESLMIKGVYGIENLSNTARGHHDERFRAFGDWEYQEGYDLPSTGGELLHDSPQNDVGCYYVYVLRDPIEHEVFYVGKGIGGRLCQHFAMARNDQDFQDLPRIQRLKRLLDAGKTPKEIGFIVARVANEAMAYVIESFYMKFVVGFDRLTNVQSGHLYGMFRSRQDWEKRYGFDLPTHVNGMRRMLLDTFLGEGLDQLLAEVVQHPDVAALLADTPMPKLVGAGELAFLGQMRNVDRAVLIRIQVRCARRIQIGLHPDGAEGPQWMQEKFGNFGLYPLHRRDDLFIPRCWRGAANVTTSTEEAVKRTLRLAKLAQTLQIAANRQDLEEFNDLLVGLPRAAPAG